jgi:hypothetical protein
LDRSIVNTTVDDCNRRGGVVVGVAPEDDLPPFPYRLPSSNDVVGSFSNFLADMGTLVYVVDLTPSHLSDIGSMDFVVCVLPSGLGIVETYEKSQVDGGTVVGKIREPIPPSA